MERLDTVLDENCLFCKIVKGEEPKTLVYEDENFMVIENKYPVAPIHVLVLDKHHRFFPGPSGC
jgi:histidine triad (HIT) family protein